MDFELEPMGEQAVLLRLGEGIDAAVNARVHATCACLHEAGLDEVDELVPAYASVLVRLRTPSVLATADRRRALHARFRDVLSAIGERPAQANSREVRIPVCYGGAYGPDLAEVAERLGLSPQALAERHAAGDYRVAMLGFAPGFAYLLGMDPALQVPRRERPRTRVPAGSVGIGGAQTGIYPAQLPGGWQLIGRTPWRLFDPDRDEPAILRPGDRVRFERIDAEAFEALHAGGEGGA